MIHRFLTHVSGPGRGVFDLAGSPERMSGRAHFEEECLELIESVRVESVVDVSTIPTTHHKANIFECTQVEGEERLADLEMGLQFADRTFPCTEESDDPQSSFIGDRLQTMQNSSRVISKAARRDAMLDHRRRPVRRGPRRIEPLSHGRGRVVAWCDGPFEVGIAVKVREGVQVVPNSGDAQTYVTASPAATSQPLDPPIDILRIDLIEPTIRAEKLDRETQPLLRS